MSKRSEPDAPSAISSPPYRGKAVSGGQSGTDIGFSYAASTAGLDTGGRAPRKWRTAKGGPSEAELRALGLKEYGCDHPHDVSEHDHPPGSAAADYIGRTMANVRDSDATLAVSLRPSPGTDGTIRYAVRGHWNCLNKYPVIEEATSRGPGWWCVDKRHANRPLFVVTDLSEHKRWSIATEIRRFLAAEGVKTLNGCGHRDLRGKMAESFRKLLMLVFGAEDARQAKLAAEPPAKRMCTRRVGAPTNACPAAHLLTTVAANTVGPVLNSLERVLGDELCICQECVKAMQYFAAAGAALTEHANRTLRKLEELKKADCKQSDE